MTTPSSYDRRTITLHWITATLVVILWVLGQVIDWFPKGDPRSLARSTHIAIGVMLAFVLVRRIAWRFGGGSAMVQESSPTLETLARWTHWLLYLLLVGTVLLGLANAWIRGDTLFLTFKIPAIFPGDMHLKHSVEDFHSWAANALMIVAGLHAGAGLFHHYVLKDGVLKRMMPFRDQ